jgi:hypothetical protein
MSLYEQLYIIEEAMPQFLSFKIFEFILFMFLINFTNNKTPLPLFLIGIIGIKILSFGIISTSAFKSWKVRPTIKATLQQITIYVVVSILLSMAL